MLVFRIARKLYPALDGEGARLNGGRWNSVGLPMVYTSATASLAALELLVHVRHATAPVDLELSTIEIPDELLIHSVDVSALGSGWYLPTGLSACRAEGDSWLASGKSPVLRVPAAPIHHELNYLLNPRHTDAARISVRERDTFSFDSRLMK